MKDKLLKLEPDSVWKVFTQDTGFWRAGIYKPEHGDIEEINILEKHTCPELFICAGGRMGLLIFDGKNEHQIDFKPNDAMLVHDYHNGYAIDRDGYFIVVERTSFSTDYIDRKKKNIIKSVEVK